MAIKLSLQNLDRIGRAIAVPTYDPAKLTPDILHFGVGNFHRAHQAVYLDDLFNLGRDHDWGIIGGGVMPTDALMRVKLEEQDFLTAVIEQDNDRISGRVTAPMVGFMDPADSAAMIEKLADPGIRIVSLTITEGGYFLDPASGAFTVDHPAIVADATNPNRPRTVFGVILAGLKLRQAGGVQPFTVMSCDNISSNGEVARNAVLRSRRPVGSARLRLGDPERVVPQCDGRPHHAGAREIGIAADVYEIDDRCRCSVRGRLNSLSAKIKAVARSTAARAPLRHGRRPAVLPDDRPAPPRSQARALSPAMSWQAIVGSASSPPISTGQRNFTTCSALRSARGPRSPRTT